MAVLIPNGRDFGAHQSCTAKSNGAYQIDGYFTDFMAQSTTVVFDAEDATTIVCDATDSTTIVFDAEDATTVVVDIDQSTTITHDATDSVTVEPT